MTTGLERPRGPFANVLAFFVENRLIAVLVAALLLFWSALVVPFGRDLELLDGLPRDTVPVDAIPDTGDNQQIVFTEWPGRSPQDVEDQITYPLTVALLGVPGVQNIRSNSMFGFSAINVIFEDGVEFYWSRARLLEKLASLPVGTLPTEVQPTLGPDATTLGQVFWYTLEGRDQAGNPTGGWGLDELRTAQDFYVRYALASVEGVAEVSSVGGFVQEYQIDVDPDAMRAHGVRLQDVFSAVRESNLDVGARTLEINRAEYVVRGLGFIEGVEDLEETVVKVREGVPIHVRQIASVQRGPALRRGALDRDGIEAVGGVVVARFGTNPLEVIDRVKERIARLQASLPTKTLDDGTVSQVTVRPFYDRTELIEETLGTLGDALQQQILVTILVILLMVANLRASVLISGSLPIAVLLSFVGMKLVGVDANVVALSGIAIAIGTMVDMAIVLTQNISERLDEPGGADDPVGTVIAAAHEVGGAVLTAVLTTVVSFLPVFTMENAEGKLFQPLAWTKTFALLAAIFVALIVLPPAALTLMRRHTARARQLLGTIAILGGLALSTWLGPWVTAIVVCLGAWRLFAHRLSEPVRKHVGLAASFVVAIATAVALGLVWAPLGPARDVANVLFVALCVGGLVAAFHAFLWLYPTLLRVCLAHKTAFLALPILLVFSGVVIWRGADETLGFLGDDARAGLARSFPGLGEEFMPRLDEGSFLLMPITMPHASIGEAQEIMVEMDRAVLAIPEVREVVGKLGRVESPLDPAPVSMYETVVHYHSEFRQDAYGHARTFAFDETTHTFVTDEAGELVPDEDGRPFRQWRPHIRSPEDIWDEVAKAAQMPGVTAASLLQPIETRRVMLQTGMRGNYGAKVFGPDLETIEDAALQIEHLISEVDGIAPGTVLADRVVGKPYLNIDIDREACARHGLSVRDVQSVIEVAIGGRTLTHTVEGRERYPVRVRYVRERRDRIEDLEQILVPTPDRHQIPLGQLAKVRYERGPQSIKSEDTFLVAYVTFDRASSAVGEVELVERVRAHLDAARADGRLDVADGVRYEFAGNYQNQVRASQKLQVVLPIALGVIFLLLYLQFRSTATTLMVFAGVFVAWAGGFWMIWLYGQPWFLDLTLFDTNLRSLFQVEAIALSVAVWVGFLALFGIATDDGVVIATFLQQSFARHQPTDVAGVRAAVLEAGMRRIRPCLMTTATTLLALLPVLTSRGKGSDVMVPMAIPTFGGMTVALITLFVVPVLYSLVAEIRLRAGMSASVAATEGA